MIGVVSALAKGENKIVVRGSVLFEQYLTQPDVRLPSQLEVVQEGLW